METGRRAAATALIVEDDDVMCATIRSALDDVGFSTAACVSLFEAETAIAERRPDVVILDLTLSSEFGGDLLESLASRYDAPAVVVCSGFALAPMVAARYGIPCVRKPFELENLLETIRSAVQEKRRPAVNG
jgi:DNA-binding NtrC family response regulator